MIPAEQALLDRLGHTFHRPALLTEALTHPSYAHERPHEGPHNQRLEFLGDAVLQLLISHELHTRYPEDREGTLSRRRSLLTKGPCLAGLAREIGIDRALKLGGSEAATGGRERSSNLEDAFEALIGALYLDAGPETTRRIVLDVYGSLENRFAAGMIAENPKGRLQEWAHPVHGPDSLRYETSIAGGADHEREFFSRVFFLDQPVGEGRGHSKKSAEEAAARVACATLIPAP